MPESADIATVRAVWAKSKKRTQPPPDHDSLLRFEAEAGFPPPPDWVQWLEICNGCNLSADFWFARLYGIWDRPIRQLDLDASRLLRDKYYKPWRDLQRIPIADDGCGDYFLLGQPFPGGPPTAVMFWDQANDYSEFEYIVASNLWTFLRGVLEHLDEREGWPFDKQTLLSIDPGMEAIPPQLRPHE